MYVKSLAQMNHSRIRRGLVPRWNLQSFLMYKHSINANVYDTPSSIGLYKILPLPILYCVWHTKGKSGRRLRLRKMRAIVLQSRVSDAGGRGNTRMID